MGWEGLGGRLRVGIDDYGGGWGRWDGGREGEMG